MDDFFDAPETPSQKSKWEQWGYRYFKGGLTQANVDFLEPNSEEPSIMRLAGRPIVENGKVTDVMPFLRAKKSRRLSEPAERLFGMTTCYQVRVVRYFGPKPDFDEVNRKRLGPPQLHFIDEFPPSVRRQYVSEGRPLPQTCVDILLARAPATVARYPKYAKYYRPDDDFHSSLRRPCTVWFLNGLCLQHGKVDCDENDPLPCLHLLTWTGYKSLQELIYQEKDGYTYPEGADHDSISTRAAINERFVCPELTDPAGAPAVVLTSHKQKRRSSKGGRREGRQMEGNRYVATLTPDVYPFPADLQSNMWTPPEDLFWYPTPEEAYEMIMSNAGEKDWQDFLYHLAKGTDLETPESTRGADLEPSEDEESSVDSRDDHDPVDDYVDDYDDDEVPFEPDPPRKEGAGKTLGLGSFGQKKAEEAEKAKEVDAEVVSDGPSMPLPDTAQKFDSPGEGGQKTVGDAPESVEERTRAAKERLAQIRGRGK